MGDYGIIYEECVVLEKVQNSVLEIFNIQYLEEKEEVIRQNDKEQIESQEENQEIVREVKRRKYVGRKKW